MKKLLLLALAACLPFSVAMAQDAANFHIVYGNADGSVLSVGMDRDIEIQVWAATDPTPGNPDSVTFAHMPLASDDLIITNRNAGYFPAYGMGLWDDKGFLSPDLNQPMAGFTSQSILGFAYLNDPRDPQNFIYNLGVQQLVGTFRMHTTADDHVGETICPFIEGFNTANGSTLWGMQDGVRGVNPTKTFGCLYFSPNADPVWAEPGTSVTIPVGGCFHLRATDIDLENVLTITYLGSDGIFTPVTDILGDGIIEGDWCGDVPDGTVLNFEVFDGMSTVPLAVTVNVDCYTLTDASVLTIGNGDICVPGFPGALVDVYLNLQADGCVGGFEILINADPTALNLVAVDWLPAIMNGDEYHQWIQDQNGPGSDKFVWIADINDGHDGPPMGWNTVAEPIVKLTYSIVSTLPWGMEIPIVFDHIDYTSNTLSDVTGYLFVAPQLVPGCVETTNPADFKGDPNMNCYVYEIADAVLVAQRLIEGYVVWAADDAMANVLPCTRHFAGNDPLQEAAGDLNNNTFVDIADLVRFINIINGFIMPKLDPISGQAVFTMNNGSVNINSPVEVGGVLVRINHDGEIGTPVANNGMEIMSKDVNGVLSVLVYSMSGNRIAAGNQTLFTVNGQGTIAEVSASDSYGRLLDATASLVTLPTQYSVSQNYPNPFNAKTLINFSLPTASDVTVNIYSITGQLVESLGGHYDAGFQSVVWDASHVSSGVYFYKVSANEFSQTMKMTLVK